MKLNINFKKNINFFLVMIIIILICFISFCFIFYRQIKINTIFLLYDTYSLFGLYWKIDPRYCSPMKYGFTPVMPLEFYADFNKSIFNRIITGNNTLNKEEVIKICDRNLDWLKKKW